MKGQFDVLGYLSSRMIHYDTEGKNISQGWTGVKCPFCSDKSNHLGINLTSFAISCFKCGESGFITKYIAAMEPEGWGAVRGVMKEFASQELLTRRPREIIRQGFVPPTAANAPLSPTAIKYLKNERGFAYRYLEKKYQIKCFRPTSTYKFRIYIPVFVNSNLVTFTTRSYSKQVEPKYLHYPKQSSILFAKETLYNLDNATGDTAVVVEGPTDAWRIGDGAVATFGVIFTEKQVKIIRERFKRVFIMYDSDRQAQAQAQRLACLLASFNLSVNNVALSWGDPGGLSHTDAKHIRKEIFGR